jgi:WD40 repeat protein
VKFLHFISAVANTDDTTFARRLPVLNAFDSTTRPANQVVRSVFVSAQHNLLIVGTGFNPSAPSAGKAVGQVIVYTMKTVVPGTSSVAGNSANKNASSWSFENLNFMKTCDQDFSVGVSQVSYEPLRRLVLVGLSNGPLVFFFLSEHSDELLYRTELNCHYSAIMNIIVDTTYPDSHYCISSSHAGSVCAFNLSSGFIDSQATCEVGQKAHCIAYNPYDRIVICGTGNGQVILFDFDRNPGIVSLVLKIEEAYPAVNQPNVDVVSVSFDSKRRLLYAAAGGDVYVWRIYTKEKNVSLKAKFQRIIKLGTDANICNSLLLNDAQFLLVGENSGRMAMFDLFEITNYPLRQLPQTQPSSWEDAVQMGFTSMLAFLHKKNVDTSAAVTRDDIVSLMANRNGVTEDEIIDMLIPKKQGNEIILAWSTAESPGALQKQTTTSSKVDRSLFCSTLLPLQEYIVCGGDKGNATLFSLADFIVPAAPTPVNNNQNTEITLVMTECRYVALRNGLIINCKGNNVN